MPEVSLIGVRPRPLLGYLKGLGVLRVVAREADGDVRGRWRHGSFELASELDEEALERFLIEEYAPSPVASPWNGGSGFFPKDRQEPLLAIESSTTPRFAAYRATIAAARRALEQEGLAEKPAPDTKPALIRRLRRTAPDEALDWLDAAIVVRSDGLSFPPLLGSGGNDGRFDFSNNYARSVVECILDQGSGTRQNLLAALWDGPAKMERKLSLAHFSRDSSPNNSPHGEADSLGNPWDLVLAVEGALTMAAGAGRRHGTSLPGSLSAPFTANPTSSGFSSGVDGEPGRAELWLPLWGGWASQSELTALAREARAQVGGAARRTATTGLDFARAAGELGVASGIDSFERYAILERAGQSNLAVPVGRVKVADRPAVRALREIEGWLSGVSRYGGRDECPRAPRSAIRGLEQAAFEMASTGTPEAVCATLEAIGGAEAALARSTSAAGVLRPVQGAFAESWIAAADDGTPELAIAVGLASLRDSRSHGGAHARDRVSLPTMRDYLHGTVSDSNGRVAFDPDRDRVVGGGTLFSVLAELHARRHMEAARAGMAPSFESAIWTPLPAARLLVKGNVDERRVLALLRGLVVLDFDRGLGPGRSPAHISEPHFADAHPQPEPVFELLTLAWQPQLAGREGEPRLERAIGETTELHETLRLAPRPDWAAQLLAGSVHSVMQDALLRLRMSGLPPLLRVEDLLLNPGGDRDLGQRLAASLLLRVGRRDMKALVDTYINEKQNDKRDEKEDQ